MFSISKTTVNTEVPERLRSLCVEVLRHRGHGKLFWLRRNAALSHGLDLSTRTNRTLPETTGPALAYPMMVTVTSMFETPCAGSGFSTTILKNLDCTGTLTVF